MSYAKFLENFPVAPVASQATVMAQLGHLAHSPDFQVNLTSALGETGLFLAVSQGWERMAEWFMDRGADPWICPVLTSMNGFRKYLSTSIVQVAIRKNISEAFLIRLLNHNKTKTYQHLRSHLCEYSYINLIQILLRHGPWYNIGSEVIVKRIMLLLSYGAPLDTDAYEHLINAYLYGESYISRKDLEPVIGEIAWAYMRDDLSAYRIQTAWRTYRKRKASIQIQRFYKTYLYHPDHIWTDGKTTTDRLFGAIAAH
jgi:hypothetical protein